MRLRWRALQVYLIIALSVSGNASLEANRPDGSILNIGALIWILIELIMEWRRLSNGTKD